MSTARPRSAASSDEHTGGVRLEDLTPGAVVRGVVGNEAVTVVATRWHGNDIVTLTYRTGDGRVHEELVYRDQEPTLFVGETGRAFSFDGDGALFRLAAEARRIQLAYLFDPMLAVTTSVLRPLPHQIEAVYGEMLPRQPLRFLLADDPGAGKTIMAGLYIKELMLRGDLQRCLVVAPGSLVEQWQDELATKFGLQFTILTRELVQASLGATRSPSAPCCWPGSTCWPATRSCRPSSPTPTGTSSSSTRRTG